MFAYFTRRYVPKAYLTVAELVAALFLFHADEYLVLLTVAFIKAPAVTARAS